VRVLSGERGAWWPELEGGPHAIDTPHGGAWLEPVPGNSGTWLQLGPDSTPDATRAERARAAAVAVGELLGGEREAAQVAAELANRYEEINLLYTISDILGRTVHLEEAAQTIVREVSDVVGARRASIMVYDPDSNTLRVVAGRGLEPSMLAPVSVHDECSIAAQVFREQKALGHDAATGDPPPGCDPTRPYKGESFLSVPILYGSPGAPPRPVGVINLTDRLGEDAFTAGHKKLVGAIASQIGAAIENARLVQGERQQMRLTTELELAHNLQSALMPAPSLLARLGDIGARSRPLESVGGDFFNVITPRKDAIGVMIGDVSSHGLSAALLMAHAISAAGVLAQYSGSPEQALQRLLEQIGEELRRTEMYMSIFYGVVDRRRDEIRYANAGHPYAFIVPADGGEPRRLVATAPPLGLSSEKVVLGAEAPWTPKSDLLCLFTDGLPESRSAAGEPYGESRVLEVVRRHLAEPAPRIVEAVFADLLAYAGDEAADDRTVLVLRR
jgi:sigma-B regulation protein RsbU (phosphoserine phosphatase)